MREQVLILWPLVLRLSSSSLPVQVPGVGLRKAYSKQGCLEAQPRWGGWIWCGKGFLPAPCSFPGPLAPNPCSAPGHKVT